MRNLVTGIMIASFFWLVALALVCHRADQGYRVVEHEAFKENYKLKQRNNLVERENVNLDRILNKLRRSKNNMED